MENLIVVDLFSGAGGFSKGFLLEGFKVCVGVENFKPIAKTFIENFPDAIGDLPSPFEEHNIPDHKVFSIPKSKLKEISRLKRDEALIHFKGADGKTYTNWVRLHPYKLPRQFMVNQDLFIHLRIDY